MATVVLGAQWGDEGKGKIVDVLVKGFDLCCRAQGGHNAGHTIVKNGTTFDVHILPSGVLTDGCVNLIGSGCVVYVPGFLKEIETLVKHGIKTEDRIFISDACHVDLDLHAKIDGLKEVALGEAKIGTTGKGIGPTYASKADRIGIRIGDVFDKADFDRLLRRLATGFKARYGDLLQYDPEEEIIRFDQYRELLRPYVVKQGPLIHSTVQQGLKILAEGANALMLDIDAGTYPFVTSSNTDIGGIQTGLKLPYHYIREVIGIVKAYTTRVGSGPFPTEQLNEVGERLQQVGREVGVTTGRKRRCGWLDLVILHYSWTCNHYTSINLTKLDILDDFDEIKVGVQYIHNGQALEVSDFPTRAKDLSKVEVKYETLPGWKSNTVGAKNWDDLPENAKKYIEYIESFIKVPIKYIGTGPKQEDMIFR